jgi:hypothetical protein
LVFDIPKSLFNEGFKTIGQVEAQSGGRETNQSLNLVKLHLAIPFTALGEPDDTISSNQGSGAGALWFFLNHFEEFR